MSWTTPRTWVVAEVLTAALLNTHVRDNESYLYDHGPRKQVATKVVGDSPYTVTDSDDVIRCDCTSGAITINLPTAVGIGGRVYEIKKIDASANAVTVDASSTQTIDGALTLTIGGQYESYSLRSNNANWDIV